MTVTLKTMIRYKTTFKIGDLSIETVYFKSIAKYAYICKYLSSLKTEFLYSIMDYVVFLPVIMILNMQNAFFYVSLVAHIILV